MTRLVAEHEVIVDVDALEAETLDALGIPYRDEGPGFDPATLPDPTASPNLEEPSGRGLLLIHAFMDEGLTNYISCQVFFDRVYGPVVAAKMTGTYLVTPYQAMLKRKQPSMA